VNLLLYNPNTDVALTDRLTRALAPFIGAGDKLDAATAPRGPSFIGSDETIVAARAALNEQAGSFARGADAVLLGCFGDIGLDAIRPGLDVPIVSLSDACFALASFIGPTAIVTTSPFWAARFEGDVLRRGLGSAVVAVRTIGTIMPFARERVIEECRHEIARLAAERTARSIILGGALLAELRDALLPDSRLPIVDLLGAAVGLCRALAATDQRGLTRSAR
jgi:allantoin racemase